MSRFGFALIAFCFLILSPAHADEGNGQGNAIIRHGPVQIGGVLTVEWGSPGLAGAQSLFIVSDGLGPTTFQGIPFCIDVNSPAAQVVVDTPLDAAGFATFNISVPNIPGLTTLPPTYAQALVVDFSVSPPFATSKAVAFRFENPGGFSTTSGPLGTARALHTATALAEDSFDQEVEVLVTGGGGGNLLAPAATDTTEIFSPVSRQFRPGPTLSDNRALHQAIRLQDGRVLIIGGSNSSGAGLATCELYDPVTETLSPTGSMNEGRAGHAATLLADGRVFVTGGLPSFNLGLGTLDVLLNNAHDDAEVYDPSTGAWTLVANAMSDKRFAHAQVLLPDGRVLVTGGIDGGANFLGAISPTYTASCNIYDPATNSFSASPALLGARGGHAISLLGNGEPLVTGGIQSGFLGIPFFSGNVQRFNSVGWVSGANLPLGVALHTQVPAFGNGDALIIGGITGLSGTVSSSPTFTVTDQVVRHDGTAPTVLGALGTNPGDPLETARPRGSHTCTPLYDETFVIIGGTDDIGAFDTGLVYLEN